MDGSPIASRQRGDAILVVDDDAKIVNLARAYLVAAGFAVITAADGLEALEKIRNRRPRLIVLDLMLPGLDGLEVTRQARSVTSTPILMLTARSALADRIAGFGAGADDYLAKPFSPSELVARVKAILRRTTEEASQLRHLDLVVDIERQEARLGAQLLDLTLIEFRLLVALLGGHGRVLTREQLMKAVEREDPSDVMRRTVDVYISRLRRKLADDPDRPRFIATIRGTGYRLAGDR